MSVVGNRVRFVDPSHTTSMARVRTAVVKFNQVNQLEQSFIRQKALLDDLMGSLSDIEKREYALRTGADPFVDQRGKHKRRPQHDQCESDS